MKEINEKIEIIEERNKRVEKDKAWETSKTRIFIIIVLTYIFATLYLAVADTANPFLGSVIPCVGFLLSTQSLKIFKQIWLKKHYK
jgi:hypothetical protein